MKSFLLAVAVIGLLTIAQPVEAGPLRATARVTGRAVGVVGRAVGGRIVKVGRGVGKVVKFVLPPYGR